MMKTEQIAAELGKELASRRVLELRDAIAHRRTQIKERQAAIETERRASFDPARHVALNGESESLDIEDGLLYDCDSKSFRAHEEALNREAEGVARDALKALPKTLKLAAAAKTEHEQLELALQELLERLCGARGRMSLTGPAVDDETFAQIASLLYDLKPLTVDQLAGGRRLLRRQLIAPEPVRYAEPEPDYRELARSPYARRDS